jgi:hypothetical protein
MRISKIKFKRNMVGTVKDEINWQIDEYDRLNAIYVALITRQLWLFVVGSHKTSRLSLSCHRQQRYWASVIMSPTGGILYLLIYLPACSITME